MTTAMFADIVAGGRGLLTGLSEQPPDTLLALIGLHRTDPRPHKIDVGVGVYKDADGRTPVFAAVKAAERHLLADQQSKSYLGPEGDIGFFAKIARLALGDIGFDQRLSGFQTPGGTGALRLGAEVIARARAGGRVHVGMPTWANHAPLLQAAGLEIVPYRHFDVENQQLCFADVVAALGRAEPGDVILLHGCCHNPTGADFSIEQWHILAALMAERGLLPFVDIAYQGLGDGLDEDARGVRIVAAACPELLVAYSCDKNFGLYRERVGALFALSADPRAAAVTQSNLLALARANWSMPPDHGAAIVRIVLDSGELTQLWRAELDAMRARIVEIRTALAALDPVFAPLAGQKGMFSTLSLSPAQVVALREEHAIYMAESGRISVAGLTPAVLPAFAAAVRAVL